MKIYRISMEVLHHKFIHSSILRFDIFNSEKEEKEKRKQEEKREKNKNEKTKVLCDSCITCIHVRMHFIKRKKNKQIRFSYYTCN